MQYVIEGRAGKNRSLVETQVSGLSVQIQAITLADHCSREYSKMIVLAEVLLKVRKMKKK